MIGSNLKEISFINYDEKYAMQCHYNFLCQSETAKYTLWRPSQTINEAKEKLNRWTSGIKENDIFWLIFENKSNQVIGFICAEELMPKVYGNVGIAIGLEFINKGYGSQSLKELIKVIKNKGGEEIHYSHFEENEASKQLALKFGFKYYKQDIRVRQYDNKSFNELFYVLKLNS